MEYDLLCSLWRRGWSACCLLLLNSAITTQSWTFIGIVNAISGAVTFRIAANTRTVTATERKCRTIRSRTNPWQFIGSIFTVSFTITSYFTGHTITIVTFKWILPWMASHKFKITLIIFKIYIYSRTLAVFIIWRCRNAPTWAADVCSN